MGSEGMRSAVKDALKLFFAAMFSVVAILSVGFLVLAAISSSPAMHLKDSLAGKQAYFVIPDEKLKNVVDVRSFRVVREMFGFSGSYAEADVSYHALVKLAGNNTVCREAYVEIVNSPTKVTLELDYYFVKDHVVYHAERDVTAKVVVGKHLAGVRAINASVVHYQS